MQELRVLEHRRESSTVFGPPRQCCELAVPICESEVPQRQPIATDSTAHVLILPARDLGDDLVIGVQQVDEGAQVLADRFEQLRPLELRRHDHERAVGDHVVGEGAALGELAVAIDVDAFGQPLVDPPHEACVGEQLVDLRERGADHPAVVGRMDAALGHAAAGAHQERPKDARDLLGAVPTADRRGRRDIVNHEAGVGRGVEVRREQVDVALRTLRTLEKAGRQADAMEQGRILMKRGSGVDERRSQRLDHPARRSCRVQSELIAHAAAVGARRVGDLRLEQAADAFVVPLDDVGERRHRQGFRRLRIRGRPAKRSSRAHQPQQVSARVVHRSSS